MANKLIQTVFQTEEVPIPKRMIVQYLKDDESQGQNVVLYEDLNDEEKVIFDSFKDLSESKMV